MWGGLGESHPARLPNFPSPLSFIALVSAISTSDASLLILSFCFYGLHRIIYLDHMPAFAGWSMLWLRLVYL